MPSPVADQHGTYESVGGVHQPLIRKAGWSGLWLGWLRGVEVVVDQGELAPVILPGRVRDVVRLGIERVGWCLP